MTSPQGMSLNWTFIFTMWAITSPLLLLPLYFFWKERRKHRLMRRDIDPKASLAAHMPLDYLKPEPRKLKEVPLGETVWISFTDIQVDKRGRTFVDANARVREEELGSHVKVRLEKNGAIVTRRP